MHFNALFHPHVFSKIFLNNNFQFLNTHTKRVLNYSPFELYYYNASHVEWLTKLKNWNKNAKIQSSMKKSGG